MPTAATRDLALSFLDQKGMPKTPDNLNRAMQQLQSNPELAQRLQQQTDAVGNERGPADFARPSFASLTALDADLDAAVAAPTTPQGQAAAETVQQSPTTPPSLQEPPLEASTRTSSGNANNKVLRNEAAAAALPANDPAVVEAAQAGEEDSSDLPPPPIPAARRRQPGTTGSTEVAASGKSGDPLRDFIDVEFSEVTPPRQLTSVEQDISNQIDVQDAPKTLEAPRAALPSPAGRDATARKTGQQLGELGVFKPDGPQQVKRIGALGLGTGSGLAVVQTPEGNVRVFDVELADGSTRLVAADGRVFNERGVPLNETIDLQAAAQQLGDTNIIQRVRAAAAALRGAF